MAEVPKSPRFTPGRDPRFAYDDEVSDTGKLQIAELIAKASDSMIILAYDGDDADRVPGALLLLHNPTQDITLRYILDKERIIALIGQLAESIGLGVIVAGRGKENKDG